MRPMLNPNNHARYLLVGMLLLAVFIFALNSGAVKISFQQLMDIIGFPLFHRGNFSAEQFSVVWFLRLPRLLAIALVGAGLGISGAVMQGLLRNPLADPGLLGLSSGASLAIILVWLIGGPLVQLWQWLTPLLAMVGSLAVFSFLYISAKWTKQNSMGGLILIGLACNALFSACIALLLYVGPANFLQNAVLWSFGGVSSMSWTLLASGALLSLGGGVLLFSQASALNLMALGEEDAMQLGLNLARFKAICILGVSMIVAAAVALAGPIAFVGLMVPHIMRRIFGSNHQHLLSYSGFGGAILLLLADRFCQSFSQSEILPLGIVTALMGALFFIWLLFYYRNS
ncbi:MAG: iron ABC transporter permease [Gammaproteobacteria bacterium]|nr:iron ABC transporter permease [Gammaproteobacteria bacterium]